MSSVQGYDYEVLLRTLCMLSRDDVYFGMLRSLEGEPDR